MFELPDLLFRAARRNNRCSFNDGLFRNDNVSHDNFPYVNLRFIVVSVFAFDEFNIDTRKKIENVFFKFFAGMKA